MPNLDIRYTFINVYIYIIRLLTYIYIYILNTKPKPGINQALARCFLGSLEFSFNAKGVQIAPKAGRVSKYGVFPVEDGRRFGSIPGRGCTR